MTTILGTASLGDVEAGQAVTADGFNTATLSLQSLIAVCAASPGEPFAAKKIGGH